MSTARPAVRRALGPIGLGLLVLALIAVGLPVAEAQQFQNTRAVGGIFVDTAGMLSNADVAARGELQRAIAKAMRAAPGELGQMTEMRKVSLKGLEAALKELADSGKALPDEVVYLGGLQRIEYVIVYPENNDIVLVGPAEGWKAAGKGSVVGVTTGRPVMLLDDLIVALRSVSSPQPSVISCSIDPSREGLQRLRAHTARLRTIGNPDSTAMGIEQQLGPQEISVTGVPGTSHFARVMVAADYRMKRVSMNLEPSPVPGLTSFITMIRTSGRGMSNMLPRWWLAPDYQPMLRDADGLTWQLRGASVKTMSETDFLDASGVKHQTGKTDPVSKKWADNMTEHYEELSIADPIFGQLRNCMDLAVVGALIVRHDLLGTAGLDLPMLMSDSGVPTAEMYTPKQVASKASLMHKGRSWTIACGGVQINPWEIIREAETSDSLATVRSALAYDNRGAWWSN